MGRTPPVVLGLDLSGVVIAAGHGVRGKRSRAIIYL
jgi:NADPH:quinone reductase-like Zn-dependent oxidoreductase